MNRFGIGQPVRRVEDLRFITGRGRYVADTDLTRPDREGVAGSQLPPQFMPEDMGGPKGYRAIRAGPHSRGRQACGRSCGVRRRRDCGAGLDALEHARVRFLGRTSLSGL